MENYSIREIIEQAIQTEKLGYGFYRKMAERYEENDIMRGLFETLAGQELKHEKVFTALKEKTDDELIENWEEASKYLRAIVESEYFLGKGKSLTSLEHLKSEMDIINYAIGFEKETLLYYHSLRDIVGDKETIDELIREEKSHIVWLNDCRKSISK
jgi:rubrerythrin